ncbi:hypothetical protein [Cyanobium sp. Morenito 9A2]|uniref:hypothetical protein n=1 Tax=Cyanobium sp. Morenito 9A2 TaxID=2823718 RepID=UPI0020CFE706|nr:hypothetical protein [Cyanobium sp. Morenito 9A2]MCP9848545.1 hypothetical protein [Cyanobium sp. Morenito 9A2]
MSFSSRASSLLLACLSTLLAGPAQAGSNWLKCTFTDSNAIDPARTVSWFVKSQEAKKSVEFINTTKQRFTLNAIYTPNQIVFIYPRSISRDVSVEVEFRLNRQTLAVKKQVNNEPSVDTGSCAFVPAP